MSERDILIERLERKLAERERELSELRRMNREELEKIKLEIVSQLRAEMREEIQRVLHSTPIQKTSDLESRIVELRKALESIIAELAYVKGELKSLIEKEEKVSKEKRREIVEEHLEKAIVAEENDAVYVEKRKEVAKPRIIEPEEKGSRKKEEDNEEGLIVCD